MRGRGRADLAAGPLPLAVSLPHNAARRSLIPGVDGAGIGPETGGVAGLGDMARRTCPGLIMCCVS